jgi:hypothetical protein
MMTLQTIQTAVPVAQPHVRTPGPVETVAAVTSSGAGDRPRNDLAQDSGQQALSLVQDAKTRKSDPSDLVGPPPSFSANVLEAERDRLRDVDQIDTSREAARPGTEAAAEPADTRAAEARATEARTAEVREEQAETRDASQTTRSAYGGVREDPPRMLDVSR